MGTVEEVMQLLGAMTPHERKEIFQSLRSEFPIHRIEEKLNTDAEIILEAIDRASDLTKRGIRGVIAEAAFATDVVALLNGWTDVTPTGNLPYDFALDDGDEPVRVQVKLQRQKSHRPMRSDSAPRWAGLRSGLFVVETQRTRGGKGRDGASTRPYRFSEFEILAVSLHPSTNDWTRFMYTVASWLIPHPDNPGCIQKYQPVSPTPDRYWTDDFLTCVARLRTGIANPLPYERP